MTSNYHPSLQTSPITIITMARNATHKLLYGSSRQAQMTSFSRKRIENGVFDSTKCAALGTPGYGRITS